VLVKLKGVHRVRKRLADGSVATYRYAWRGGPRLEGEPGSPEFLESYNRARKDFSRVEATFLKGGLIRPYLQSPEFAELSERSKKDYRSQISKIEETFGDLPLKALNSARVTKLFLDWRDGMGTSPRQADYAFTVLSLLLSWGRGRGITTYRPPGRIKRLYKANRSEKVWSDKQLSDFTMVASLILQWALVLATETGQRQGDLLALPWIAWDTNPTVGAPQGWISLTQAKTGQKVDIPVTARLSSVLRKIPRRGPIILTNPQGRPWRDDAFRRAWGAASKKAGIGKKIALGNGTPEADRTFNDLRGTAITRLAEAGCTELEIAAITGHSFASVHRILEHYLAPTRRLAAEAMKKLENTRKRSSSEQVA
jgi:hypothetical protein